MTPVSFAHADVSCKDQCDDAFSPVLRYSILGLICLVSFLIRLFAVVRYESVFVCFIFPPRLFMSMILGSTIVRPNSLLGPDRTSFWIGWTPAPGILWVVLSEALRIRV